MAEISDNNLIFFGDLDVEIVCKKIKLFVNNLTLYYVVENFKQLD